MNSITEWNLRAEILAISHRWPLPVMAFLLGGLIGWGLAMFFPTQYRAEIDLFVAYNADLIYRNPDDYKNWQMRQLNDLATTDEVLGATLEVLRAGDPYWQTVEVDELRQMCRVLWRNTGKWRLVIENYNPRYSEQAVLAWTDVFLSYYNTAKSNAYLQVEIDKQLQATANNLAFFESRLSNLQSSQQQLDSARLGLANLPPDQPMPSLAYWQTWSLASQAASLNPPWSTMLADAPGEGASPAAMQSWLEQIEALIAAETANVEERVAQLSQEYAGLSAEFNAATEATGGLSANLEVGRQFITPVIAEPIRSNELTALVGSILGILIWSVLWLGRPAFHTR
jgi:hypothetical protein